MIHRRRIVGIHGVDDLCILSRHVDLATRAPYPRPPPSRPFAIIRRRLIQNIRVRENILKIVHVQRVLPRQSRQMSLHPRPRRRVPRAPRNLFDLRTKLRQRSSRDFLLRLSLPTHRLRRSRPTRVRSRARASARASRRRSFDSPRPSVRRPFVAIPPRVAAFSRRRRRASARTLRALARVDPRARERVARRAREVRAAHSRDRPFARRRVGDGPCVHYEKSTRDGS